jgi:hypothetical protein
LSRLTTFGATILPGDFSGQADRGLAEGDQTPVLGGGKDQVLREADDCANEKRGVAALLRREGL